MAALPEPALVQRYFRRPLSHVCHSTQCWDVKLLEAELKTKEEEGNKSVSDAFRSFLADFERALDRKLSDEDLLLKDIRDAQLSGRVVNIPANLIADAEGHVPHETIVAINDHMAGLVEYQQRPVQKRRGHFPIAKIHGNESHAP